MFSQHWYELGIISLVWGWYEFDMSLLEKTSTVWRELKPNQKYGRESWREVWFWLKIFPPVIWVWSRGQLVQWKTVPPSNPAIRVRLPPEADDTFFSCVSKSTHIYRTAIYRITHQRQKAKAPSTGQQRLLHLSLYEKGM